MGYQSVCTVDAISMHNGSRQCLAYTIKQKAMALHNSFPDDYPVLVNCERNQASVIGLTLILASANVLRLPNFRKSRTQFPGIFCGVILI